MKNFSSRQVIKFGNFCEKNLNTALTVIGQLSIQPDYENGGFQIHTGIDGVNSNKHLITLLGTVKNVGGQNTDGEVINFFGVNFVCVNFDSKTRYQLYAWTMSDFVMIELYHRKTIPGREVLLEHDYGTSWGIEWLISNDLIPRKFALLFREMT